MATTAYTITSHYDPADRERLERETGQYQDSAEAWEIEAKLAFKRRRLPPAPRFVPASETSVASPREPAPSTSVDDVGGWYRQLARNENDSKARHIPPSNPSVFAAAAPRIPERKTRIPKTKNNWFIMNAIESEMESEPAPAPTATLADILERDPPPLPHEPQHKHPIWIALGPGNKGFSMLQNSGWVEGQALGHDVARRKTIQASELSIHEDTPRQLIDLTMDEEADGGRRALVTPLGIVLKSDRLGIGLKAKTTGPYKASQKRITHNAKALAAHVRASEEARKEKQRNGCGHRAFARQQRKEESNRRGLLAYMNQEY
ncbi:hypothetical protein C8F01DRAFT_526797 [Mycena amicta]|nr:hypothetical protein C8F01DRAFT_526797 [Mycena amicta]